jgi:hypothetical protein
VLATIRRFTAAERRGQSRGRSRGEAPAPPRIVGSCDAAVR